MVNNELLEYIKSARARGVNEETIRVVLKKNGWDDKDIDEAYAVLPSEVLETGMPPTSKEFLSEKGGLPNNPIINASTPGQIKRKGHKGLILLLLVAIFLFAGAVFAYYGYSKYFSVTPEERIFQSFQKLSEIKSATTLSEVVVGNNEVDLILKAEGAFEGMGENSVREGTVAIELHYASLQNRSSTALPDSLEAKIAFDFRVLDKILYLKLNKETVLNALSFLRIDNFKDQWIQIPFSKIGEAQVLSNRSKYENLNRPLTKEEIEEINLKYQDVERIRIIQKTSGKSGEDSVYRYVFEFTPEMSAFLKEVYTEFLIKQAATQSEISDAVEKLEEAFASIERHQGEVWIGKEDGLPRKVSFEASIISPENAFLERQKTDVSFTVYLKDFNKELVVNAPAESLTLEDLMGNLMKIGTSTSSTASSTATTTTENINQ